MSFTRVDKDGVEFYTLTKNGASGMSIAGLARLCGVHHSAIRQLLQRTHSSKTRSKWLKTLIGKDVYLAANVPSGAKILTSETCVAIIGYFAFESKHKTEEAQFAFEKFAHMGMVNWIQSQTGWTVESKALEPTAEAVEKFINARLPKSNLAVAIHPGEIIKMLQECNFSADGYRLYLYLEIMGLQEKTPSIDEICQTLDISPATFKRWLPQIHEWSHCADWLQLQPRQGTEYEIQRRMQAELGGKIEVYTPTGRIDLVTETEVIEIKKIASWKDAFGEVVIKGRSFPTHSKRIHLFGESDKLLSTIVSHCEVLDVAVTFEQITKSQL
jgi:hypothetical protein